MSTFHGLEMAKRALATQQSALYTTGHNISNANTEGYSRQRVNFEALNGYPSASRNRPQIPGQLGTGVESGSVQRIRNQFLDNQFRSENSSAGYWNARSEALSRMEKLMNEPSASGLSKTMDQFWQSLQDLAVNPGNSGARSVVLERGHALAETFNYQSKSLHNIRTDLKTQIDVTVKDANTVIEGINKLNEQIKHLETHGYDANDLYDRRDVLIDELSGIISIDVTYDNSHSPNNRVDGVATIRIVDSTGTPVDNGTLVNGLTGQATYFDMPAYTGGQGDTLQVFNSISVGGITNTVDLMSAEGSLKGLVSAYGYQDANGQAVGDYPKMLEDLDKLAYAIADEFNNKHGAIPFFTEFNSTAGAAGKIAVILQSANQINAGAKDGDGDNALLLSKVFENPLNQLDGASVKENFESIIGDLGVVAEQANRMSKNTGTLLAQVENQRLSVSAVSLDEEMTNMIKFQHAYSAAARAMTAYDEILDRIINNLGLVGR